MMTLAADRRGRLIEAMRAGGLDALVVVGASWQEAYLRYVADFSILEGTGIAILYADGRCRLWLESVADAERAEVEASGCEVAFARDLARAAGPEIDAIANRRSPCCHATWRQLGWRGPRRAPGSTMPAR